MTKGTVDKGTLHCKASRLLISGSMAESAATMGSYRLHHLIPVQIFQPV
jgi:hypothetical protein